MRATARNDRSKSSKSEMRCRLLPDDVVDACEAFRVHPVGESVAEVFDDAEAVMHHRGADLQAAGAQQQKLRRILPGGDAAHAGDGQARACDDLVGAERGQHVQRDRLDRRSRIAAVSAFAADAGRDLESVEIDRR